MKVMISSKPFNPWSELADYQNKDMRSSDFGATAVFVGTMRESGAQGKTHKMSLEHYPGMTESEIASIIRHALAESRARDAMVIHRVGDVRPGDPIVLVAVWGQHRQSAYEANRQILEALKTTAPFWKKEHMETHSAWVPGNTI